MPTFQTIFAVDGNTQTIQTMSGGSIRAKSKHYFNAVFRFGADDPFLELDYLSATFSPVPFERCRNGAYIVPLTAQDSEREAAYVAYECEIPWEVLTRKGKVYVGVFAGDMLVTNEAQIEITAAAPVLGADSQPTQSWWGRFAAAIAQLTAALIGKQDKLTAGENITIDSNNVISASGGAVIQPYTDNPAMDGTASAGSSDAYARGDHTHPTDTSRASQESLEGLEYTVGGIYESVQSLDYAKYAKPVGGIPKTDLAESVQSSLDKADSALQSHQSLAAYRTAAAQDVIDGAQDTAIAAKYSKPSGGIPASDIASGVIPSSAEDVGAIAAPASASTGDVLTYDGSAWVAGQAGLSTAAKDALLALLEKVAYVDTHGEEYLEDLEDALYGRTLSSITAVFTQGGATIYDTDSLDTLRQYLVVAANYSDSTTRTVTDYTLSGTLTAGTSTITATYRGKTATFNVTVSVGSVVINGTSLQWEFGYIDASGNLSTQGAGDGTYSSGLYAIRSGRTTANIALIGSSGLRNAYYDKNQSFISRALTAESEIPTNAAYGRATIMKSSLGNLGYDGTGTTITLS